MQAEAAPQPTGLDSRAKTTVTFPPNDPANPRNFAAWRKWTIVSAITLVDLSVSWAASGFSPATEDFEKSFNVSAEVGVLGLSLYVLGLALGAMTLAPLSEYFGRTPLYLVPYGIFLLFLLGTALVHNLAGFLILRILSGLFSSVTIANFGGTIADLWPRHEGHGAGGMFSGLGICAGLWLILLVVLVPFSNETRHSVLLRRRAAQLRKERNTSNISVPTEMKRKSPGQLFKITLTRAFRFLATEAIIMFAAAYNGYLYGLSFLFNGAFNLVFGEHGYGFGVIGVGLSFIGFIIGVSLGPVVNIWQEKYYQRRIRNAKSSGTDAEITGGRQSETEHYPNIPEARLQVGKIAGLLFPISLFWFAWTSEPEYHIHWIVPILATALFGFSFYTLILMTYVYIEDSYMVFSASALAGVGLVRNLFGAGFPLFGTQMFENEGYNWAGTILAFLALVLAPIPFVLERYGRALRGRSPFARQHMSDSDDGKGDGETDDGS